jgi:hypothetical protein
VRPGRACLYNYSLTMTLRAFYEAENSVWVNSSTDSTLIALPRASYSRAAYMCSVGNFQSAGVQFRPSHQQDRDDQSGSQPQCRVPWPQTRWRWSLFLSSSQCALVSMQVMRSILPLLTLIQNHKYNHLCLYSLAIDTAIIAHIPRVK